MTSICNAIGCANLKPCRIHPNTPLARRPGWRRLRALVLDRDHHQCQQCGKPCPHPLHHPVDHIIPRSDGGPDSLANLRTVCALFNSARHSCE